MEDTGELEIIIKNCTARIFGAELLPLEEELSFVHRSKEKTEKTFYDRRTRTMKKYMVDGPVVSNKVPLYMYGDRGEIVTYAGLVPRVVEFANESNFRVSVRISKKHSMVAPTVTDDIFDGLYEDQEVAARALLRTTTGGMLDAATSAGKTHVIASLCRAFPNSLGLVVTNRQSVVMRLYSALKDLCPGKNRIGVYISNKKVTGEVVIITAASLKKFDPSRVDFIVYDECHGASGEARSRDLVSFYRSMKYGLSATIHNSFSGIHNYLEAIFGPIVHTMTDEDIEVLGRASPLNVYIINVTSGPPSTPEMQDLTMEKRGIWYNDARNKMIESCCNLVPDDQQMIVFVRTKYHLDHLKENYLKEFEVYHGMLPAAEKKTILERFNSGECKRIISTDSLSEGVDPSSLFVSINANWTQSDKSVVQKAGRNRRLAEGKTHGVVIDFNDCWDDRFARKSLSRLKKYENRGYNIIDSATPESIEFCT